MNKINLSRFFHYYYIQHDMDELLAVIAADQNLSRLNPAAGPLDITADGEVVGALTEWADLEAILTADPDLWSGGLLPEDNLTPTQIRAEQNVDVTMPIVYDHVGSATWIVGQNGADLLSGGSGNDLIFGDDSADTLQGEGGNDVLLGGAGVDIYKYRPNDGNDTLIDSDKKGIILHDPTGQPQALAVGLRQSTDPTGQYKSPDNTMTYQVTGPDLTITTPTGDQIPTNLNDDLDATVGTDAIYGLAGNDVLIGGKGRERRPELVRLVRKTPTAYRHTCLPITSDNGNKNPMKEAA